MLLTSILATIALPLAGCTTVNLEQGSSKLTVEIPSDRNITIKDLARRFSKSPSALCDEDGKALGMSDMLLKDNTNLKLDENGQINLTSFSVMICENEYMDICQIIQVCKSTLMSELIEIIREKFGSYYPSGSTIDFQETYKKNKNVSDSVGKGGFLNLFKNSSSSLIKIKVTIPTDKWAFVVRRMKRLFATEVLEFAIATFPKDYDPTVSELLDALEKSNKSFISSVPLCDAAGIEMNEPHRRLSENGVPKTPYFVSPVLHLNVEKSWFSICSQTTAARAGALFRKQYTGEGKFLYIKEIFDSKPTGYDELKTKFKEVQSSLSMHLLSIKCYTGTLLNALFKCFLWTAAILRLIVHCFS